MRVEKFPAAGEKVQASDFLITSGGQAGNAAVAVARLGAVTSYIGALGDTGDDVANTIIKAFAGENIDVSGAIRVPGARSSVSLILLDASGENLVYKKYFHIGFAADTPNGLVVPVIRDADKKGVNEIARETGELAAKAREGKLGPADMSGGCFSISSLGGIGGTGFTPIVNAPEVAILGVSKSATKPVWDGKQFIPRLILPLSLSWDHRVIDGAAAARFNVYFASLLADMRRVLF